MEVLNWYVEHPFLGTIIMMWIAIAAIGFGGGFRDNGK